MRYFLSIAAFVLLSLALSAQKIKDKHTASLQEATKIITTSFKEAMPHIDKSIVLDEASVTFSVVKTNTIDGSFKILIFKLGRKRTKEKETTVTYNYKRPDTEAFKKDSTITQELTRIIIDAGNEFLIASPPYNLDRSDFEIEITFAITKTTSGGLEFTIFSSDAGVGKEWEKKATHTLKLKFKKL